MMKTLFLQPPSFDGFDGGAGSRYQAKREIKSFWFPTWLAQPAALVPGSKLIDAPPARIGLDGPHSGNGGFFIMDYEVPRFELAERMEVSGRGDREAAGAGQARS